MAHFVYQGQPTNLVELGVGGSCSVELWGAGPGGEALEVSSSDASVFRVDEVQASFRSGNRVFTVRGVARGSARLVARLPSNGAVWADTRVVVGLTRPLIRYYHGTNSAIADLLMSADLTPMFLTIQARGAATAFDWSDYTDFGKGFYVHLEENKRMAYEWARRRFPGDWGVVEFIATIEELRPLASTALHFDNKRDRPPNAPERITVTTTTTTTSLEYCPLPQLLPCVRASRREIRRTVTSERMSWLEFVEFNRHIQRSGALIARPNDRDWSGTYSRIRGPIWVPRDSGYDTGLPVFPEHIHQLNWGQAAMTLMNRSELKTRRFKFGAHNEGIFPPPT